MKNTLSAFALVAILSLLPLQGFARQNAKPLTEADVVYLLKNDVPPTRVAELAKKKGIDFELTPETEKELRQAGANAALISALGKLPPGASAPAAASQAASTLARAKELFKASRFSEALPLFQESASNGNAEGLLYMGAMYEYGHGMAQNYKQAGQWYEKAAAAGNADAMYRLGFLNFLGLGRAAG